MKKIYVLLFLPLLILITGCIKRDSMEEISIYTTSYPITYISDVLYGNHSTITSIYPNGVEINKYELTDKQIKDYSKGTLFIFNGLSPEKDYVEKMFKHNKKLMIIDTTQSMDYSNGEEELWLDPSNFLMMAANIKNGLNEYINNHYLKNDIEQNYQNLRIEVSNLDAKMQLASEKAVSKKIVVSSNLFKYLDKYGLEVYSLEDKNDKLINDVKKLIKNGEVDYIFIKQNEEINDTIKSLIEETKVSTLTLHTISNLTDNENSAKKDYMTLMNENLEQLKLELYE